MNYCDVEVPFLALRLQNAKLLFLLVFVTDFHAQHNFDPFCFQWCRIQLPSASLCAVPVGLAQSATLISSIVVTATFSILMFLKVYKCIGQTSPRTSTIQFLEIARRPGRLFAAWLDADSIALLDDVWRACRHVESQNRSHNDQANFSGSAVLAPATTLGEFVVFDESQVFPEYIVPGLESVVVLWSTHVAAERFKCFTFCPRLWCSFAY